ncbi:M48 family metallopeptidase [Chitinophaga sp. Cy-1792]|uniref:M48 family metallopeptidase n=1 Tax=Chitinophaga sp. Cy-1792 TaxID=2608339 RepID=UPI001420D5BA|nr:M48 family metallopeptidase [Chitinophaga sp. Cy-1792]NIG53122.1 M48 family metalloprotease [Chitinophaga sp. Cy-1792]
MTNLNLDRSFDSDHAVIATTIPNRQQKMKVFGFIILFFLLYVVLISIAGALALGCIAGGLTLIRYYDVLYAVIPGIALIVLGSSLLYFLGRFLFHRHQPVNPYRTQINADNHPRLFAFLQQLVADTRISFPRKIFVVPDVRASLFYNASFFNLFWPIRRNLEIGLGLVNSVNISEFKMLLAHEFGHFSRENSSLSRYVYGLNKMLHDMLYENDDWNELARHRHSGSISGFFIHITLLILNGMQYLLRQMHRVINKHYQDISRDIAIQADEIALHMAGTRAAISAIRRADIGSYCMEHCMHKLPELSEHKLRFQNLYEVQRNLIRYYTLQSYGRVDAEGLPVVTGPFTKAYLKSRVQLRDEWSLQPSLESRISMFLQANVDREQLNTSAWQLFNQPAVMQEAMTGQVYSVLSMESNDCSWICPQQFVDDLEQRQRTYEFPKVFNSYYDNRSFAQADFRFLQPLSAEELKQITLETLYHPDVVMRMRTCYRDLQDSETLHAIAVQQLQTRHFEFDGKRYRANKAERLARKLSRAAVEERQWLTGNDLLACRYHYTVALASGQQTADNLVGRYQEILDYQRDASLLSDLVIRIIHGIGLIFNSNHQTMEEAVPSFDMLTETAISFRKLLLHLITAPAIRNNLPGQIEESIEYFRQHDCQFIRHGIPDYAGIKALHDISNGLMEYLNNRIILLKKEYLELLIELDHLHTTN